MKQRFSIITKYIVTCIANGNAITEYKLYYSTATWVNVLAKSAIKIIALPLFYFLFRHSCCKRRQNRNGIFHAGARTAPACRCCWSIGCCCWRACLFSSHMMEQQKRPTQQRANAWERSGRCGGRLTPLPGVPSSISSLLPHSSSLVPHLPHLPQRSIYLELLHIYHY